MKATTAAEMQAIDAAATEHYGIPGIVLMENAGMAVARQVESILDGLADKHICIFAGKGNNGGDGFVAARYFYNQAAQVKVFILGRTADIGGDAGINLQVLRQMGVDIFEMQGQRDWDRVKIAAAFADCIVDALVGTGFKGDAKGGLAQAIDIINQEGRLVVAVDLPSGVQADRGQIQGKAIRAAHTVTFGLPKPGLFLYPGRLHAGNVIVADIGLPRQLLTDPQIRQHIVTAGVVRHLLPKRPPDAHKGTCGRAMIVAGCRGLTGAAVLTSTATARAGAGLVTLAAAESLQAILSVKLTEVMTKGLPEVKDGVVGLAAMPVIQEFAAACDVLAVGPGLGRHQETVELVRKLALQSTCPLVLDADALHAFAEAADMFAKVKSPLVLTPHLGEMSRLMGLTPAEINQDRLEAARLGATAWRSVLVLKGAPTVVAAPDGHVYINTSGNAGMATGGTGDVLTGVICAFIAQGLPACEAAIAGVYVHGLAGDIAAQSGLIGRMAGDLLPCIPAAIYGIQTG